MKNKWHSMNALNTHAYSWASQNATSPQTSAYNNIHRHACIKTRLLLGVAKIEESKTGRINQTP